MQEEASEDHSSVTEPPVYIVVEPPPPPPAPASPEGPKLTEHAPVLQAWLDGPEQGAPPPEGGGLVQVRDCVPVLPQAVTLQLLQVLHPPLITGAAGVGYGYW